jgi:hypothetical protein
MVSTASSNQPEAAGNNFASFFFFVSKLKVLKKNELLSLKHGRRGAQPRSAGFFRNTRIHQDILSSWRR